VRRNKRTNNFELKSQFGNEQQQQQQQRAFLFTIGTGRKPSFKIDATADLNEILGNFNKPNKGPNLGPSLSIDSNSYKMEKTMHFHSQGWLCQQTSGTISEYEIFVVVPDVK